MVIVLGTVRMVECSIRIQISQLFESFVTFISVKSVYCMSSVTAAANI